MLIILLLLLLLPVTSIQGSPVDKIDPRLRPLIDKSGEEIIPVIIELYTPPNEQQIEDLERCGLVVDKVFKIINAVSGKITSKNIYMIAEFSWVKNIWLDSKKYALERGGKNVTPFSRSTPSLKSSPISAKDKEQFTWGITLAASIISLFIVVLFLLRQMR